MDAFCIGEIVYHYNFYAAKGMTSKFQGRGKRPNYSVLTV